MPNYFWIPAAESLTVGPPSQSETYHRRSMLRLRQAQDAKICLLRHKGAAGLAPTNQADDVGSTTASDGAAGAARAVGDLAKTLPNFDG